MTNPAARDFGPIADDYAFFERHATEAQEDARGHADRLRSLVPAHGPLRILDFGCGTGTFMDRLLDLLDWAPERLTLTLVEPVASRLEAAVAALSQRANTVQPEPTLPRGLDRSFDVVVVNHVLYYVPELQPLLTELIADLASPGVLVASIAPRDNFLVEIWNRAYSLIGRDMPHHVSEEVEAALHAMAVPFERRSVPYVMAFPDSEENRLRIIRFLVSRVSGPEQLRELLPLFDPHVRNGHVEVRTWSDHYMVRRGADGALVPVRD